MRAHARALATARQRHRGARWRRDLVIASLVTVVTSLPVFLVGTLAVEMRRSLHFGTAQLGLAASIYYLGAAIFAVPIGSRGDRLGSLRIIRTAALSSAVLLALLATAIRSWTALAVLLFLCGITSTAASTGTNRFLARRVPVVKQGLAFGIKQAAVPSASLVGGLAVPAIALTIGWRWAFALGATLALTAYLTAPTPFNTLAHQRQGNTPPARPIAVLPLALVGAGLGLGTFAASGLNAFLVTAGVTIGLSQRIAGVTAAAAAAAAIALRVGMGLRVDRRGTELFRPVIVLMSVGVAGYAVLAASPPLHCRWLFVGGAILAAAAGWGWNGLLNLGVIRSHMHAPARATSVVQIGGRLGGLTGPYAFGIVAERVSYTAAWMVAACALLAAAVAVSLGRRMLIRYSHAHPER